MLYVSFSRYYIYIVQQSVEKSYVTMSVVVYPIFSFTFWELAFSTLLCNLQRQRANDCHRRRLPAWSVTEHLFICLCQYVCQGGCMCVSVCAFATLKSSWMGFDKWHAALQKAGVRWLTNSGYVDNWDVTEGDSGVSLCQLGALGVIHYPVKPDNKT